jgi:hypothetical protein
MLGHGLWPRQSPWPRVKKVFWFAGGQPFFQKRTACLIKHRVILNGSKRVVFTPGAIGEGRIGVDRPYSF